MKSPRFKKAVFKFKLQQQRRSQNLSYSPDTVQCSAHISSSRSPNAPILFFFGKLRQFSRTFMWTICSNSDVSNNVLFRQEDKDCHQVKMWPPTQQLVIKSIVSNFGLKKEIFSMHLGILVFISRSCSCSLSLFIFLQCLSFAYINLLFMLSISFLLLS